MQRNRGNIKSPGRKKAAFGKKEKRRLLQLGLCICLFLVIFVSRGNELFQERQTGEKMLRIVQENTDFTAVFSALGESISRGGTAREGLKSFLIDLFAANNETDPTQKRVTVAGGAAYENTIQRMTAPVTTDVMVQFLGVETNEAIHAESNTEIETPVVAPHDEIKKESSSESEAETEVKVPEPVVYDGLDLPDGVSMEYLSLGLSSTITPVVGEISSGFGYRNHPITEEHSFHSGIDIAADIGAPIAAFADGTVEFIGESTAYGLYVQLDHGNGVKSFYCHCSELLYGKGKRIEVGQTIALVGDTGDATGSHLHLELKKEGVLLNPAYYIDLVS